MKKQHFLDALKYGVGLLLLGWVIWRYWAPAEGPGLAAALTQPLHLLPFLLAAVLCSVSVLLTFVRWYVLVRAQQLPFTLGNACRLGLIGYFLSTFLPGSVGGDVIKAAFLAREQQRRTVAVATVLIDRALGLWGLFWLVALLGGAFWLAGNETFLAQPYLRSVVVSAWAVVGAGLLLCLVLVVLPQRRADRFAGRLSRIPRVGGAAAEFWRAIWMYRCQRRWVALALAIALIAHLGFVLTFHFAARTVQLPDAPVGPPTLTEHFVVVPIGMVVQAIPSTPGGIGVGEAFYGWLYEQLKRPGVAGVFGSLAQRVITWILGFIGYLVYLRMKPALRPLPRQAAAEPTADRSPQGACGLAGTTPH